ILFQAIAAPDEGGAKKEKVNEKDEKKKPAKNSDPERTPEPEPAEKPVPWWRKLFPAQKAA
ncbi:MAG TPA: hypothetical protein VG122_00270, partial [Gemmata sp.]|nr:hypothetical protein [Gemmata sp.]